MAKNSLPPRYNGENEMAITPPVELVGCRLSSQRFGVYRRAGTRSVQGEAAQNRIAADSRDYYSKMLKFLEAEMHDSDPNIREHGVVWHSVIQVELQSMEMLIEHPNEKNVVYWMTDNVR